MPLQVSSGLSKWNRQKEINFSRVRSKSLIEEVLWGVQELPIVLGKTVEVAQKIVVVHCRITTVIIARNETWLGIRLQASGRVWFTKFL